jgi:hypothetical protein
MFIILNESAESTALWTDANCKIVSKLRNRHSDAFWWSADGISWALKSNSISSIRFQRRHIEMIFKSFTIACGWIVDRKHEIIMIDELLTLQALWRSSEWFSFSFKLPRKSVWRSDAVRRLVARLMKSKQMIGRISGRSCREDCRFRTDSELVCNSLAIRTEPDQFACNTGWWITWQAASNGPTNHRWGTFEQKMLRFHWNHSSLSCQLFIYRHESSQNYLTFHWIHSQFCKSLAWPPVSWYRDDICILHATDANWLFRTVILEEMSTSRLTAQGEHRPIWNLKHIFESSIDLIARRRTFRRCALPIIYFWFDIWGTKILFVLFATLGFFACVISLLWVVLADFTWVHFDIEIDRIPSSQFIVFRSLRITFAHFRRIRSWTEDSQMPNMGNGLITLIVISKDLRCVSVIVELFHRSHLSPGQSRNESNVLQLIVNSWNQAPFQKKCWNSQWIMPLWRHF